VTSASCRAYPTLALKELRRSDEILRNAFFRPIPLQTSCKGVLTGLEQFQNFIFSSLSCQRQKSCITTVTGILNIKYFHNVIELEKLILLIILFTSYGWFLYKRNFNVVLYCSYIADIVEILNIFLSARCVVIPHENMYPHNVRKQKLQVSEIEKL